MKWDNEFTITNATFLEEFPDVHRPRFYRFIFWPQFLITDSYVRFGGYMKKMCISIILGVALAVWFWHVRNDIKIVLQFFPDKCIRLFRLDKDKVNKCINLVNVLFVFSGWW